MSRTKSVLDEYLQNKNDLSQNVKYIPMDYQPTKMYLYKQHTYYPKKRLNIRHKSESKPNVKPYYVPVPPRHEIQSSDETFYKHTGISEHYLYQKPYANYFPREPIQKPMPNEYCHTSKYIKSPKSMHEEKMSRYYEHVNRNSGDYIREQDYYEYDDERNVDYFELERKLDYENLYLRHDELYYDYIPENPTKKRNVHVNKYSEYFPQYSPMNMPQVNKMNNYYHEENHNKNIYKEMSTKINTKTEQPKPFLEPVRQNFTKLEGKKSEAVSEISTIYERNFNLPVNITPTCNVSSQTSNCDTVECISPRIELKECFSKTTQTLEFDFFEKKAESCDKECQTINTYDSEQPCTLIGDIQDIEDQEKSKITESMDTEYNSVFPWKYVQLSKSRTNSFLCPDSRIPQFVQNHAKPFIFTAKPRTEKKNSKRPISKM